MIIGANQVMERSNLISRFTNEDYDGDSLIALALHSEQAREDFKYAYVRNQIEFEHMDELLIDYEHESIYSSYMLTLKAQEIASKKQSEIDSFKLTEIEFSIEYFNTDAETMLNKIHIKEFNAPMTIIEAAINYSLLEPMLLLHPDNISEPIYSIERDGLLDKKGLGSLTERYFSYLEEFNTVHKTELNFWDCIHEFDKFLLECSGSLSYCSPSFDLGDFVVESPDISEFKEELLSEEPYLAFHQNLILFEKISEEISKNPDNILNLVFKSGARLKSVQLLKAASNTGIPTDIYGKAFPANIKNSLLDGLTPEEYFTTGDSARLALAVRQEAIPKGGELQRKFFFATGILKSNKEVDDCGATNYYKIKVKNKKHLELLNHRWHQTEDGLIPVDPSNLELIGKDINLRSPVHCRCKDYTICKKCFGDKAPESVNLGSTVGAALSEGIIQSVLRTHHFGGAFIATEDDKLMDIMRRAKFKAPALIYDITPDDIIYIKEYLSLIYSTADDDNEIEFKTTDSSIELVVNELPFNDDSVKQLNNIVGLIDKNRDAASMIEPEVLYDKLELVIEQNGILSVYLELIISLLYYDEDDILLRYSDKSPTSQIALKNIIEILDPKLSLFYNFSNRVISKIYNHEPKGHIDHMYHDLLEIYQ